MKRDLYTCKRIYIHVKETRRVNTITRKETYIHKKRPVYMKRDLYT